jgi:hypothetical protein
MEGSVRINSREIPEKEQRLKRLGAFLRTSRLKAGHTQTEVAQAISRRPSWVCEIEFGARGARLEPLIAMTWATFLRVDPVRVLELMGLECQQPDVRRYLETAMWGRAIVSARSACNEALLALSLLAQNVGPMGEESLEAARAHIESILFLLSGDNVAKSEKRRRM